MGESNPVITAKRIQHLYAEIAKSITSSLEFSTILKKIMEQIHLFFQPQNWSLLRVDNDTGELYFVICEGKFSKKIKKLRVKLGEGIAGKVAETGKHIIVSNVTDSNQFSNRIDKISGFSTSSLIAVPIIFQSRILGVIELINTMENGVFSDRELEILETIADFSAIALHNALVHEQIIFMATHDALTKVYNRAFLDGFHTQFLDNSESINSDYALVILVDVDHFKVINDQYGHAAGDHVLIKLAELLRSSCRKSDFVFRIGGDEFLVVIANINSRDIKLVEEETRRKLSAILHDKKLNFSFSFGISACKTSELDKAIREADAKMYSAKNENKLKKLPKHQQDQSILN